METPKRFELARWLRTFDENSRRLREMKEVEGREGVWGSAECLEHLSLTAQAYLPGWQTVLESASVKAGRPYAFWWKWFLQGMLNPEKLKVKTTANFVPRAKQSHVVMLEQYLTERDLVRNVAVQVATGSLGHHTVVSPFAAWMRYPADYSLDLWLAHEGRHVTQIEGR
jgi:hypothetical protein